MRGKVKQTLAALLLGACAIASNAALAAIPAEERQALLDIYTSTNGDGWNSHAGWNGPPGTECGWQFVACDAAGEHVTGLDFSLPFESNNLMTGPLPASMANLTHLQALDVSYNHLTGPVPDLSALTELSSLVLDVNAFDSPLPPLTPFRNLRLFSAIGGGFTGPIPSLDGLTNLAEFYVWNNQLTGPIPSLAGHTSLRVFDAQMNRLSGPLPSLAGLTALEHFEVDHNALSGPIPSLDGLGNLNTFIVSSNALSGPIPSLSGLTSLVHFYVDSNALTGELPSLDGLPILNSFVASDNALDGPLPSLAGLANMSMFGVSHNFLSGPIPSLEGMTNLTSFSVSYNNLSGPVPPVPNQFLTGDFSTLCPNLFDATPNADWDAATGETPWYTECGATTVNLDQFGLTGSWYNPTTSGQGILLDAMPDMDGAGGSILFGGWFTFRSTDPNDPSSGVPTGDPSEQRWYALQGAVPAGAPEALLGIYASEGGRFAAPPAVHANLIGYARMRFVDCNTAMITSRFFVGFPGGGIGLQRLTGNTTCGHDGNNGADGANSLLSGAWYDPATAGQGVLVDISATQHTFFAAWYTFARYDGADPNQRWYTMQAENVAPDAASLANVPIYLTTGGLFESIDWITTTAEVGRASITFDSCSEMTLTYFFSLGENGLLSGTEHLSRLSPVPAGCAF